MADKMDKKARLRFIANLALGKVEASPFAAEMQTIRGRLDRGVTKLGKDPSRKEHDRSTAINFRRLKAWAEILEDEDHFFLGGLIRTGVPLGVRGEIPWIPQAYDKKEKAEKDETFQTWDDKVEDLDGDSFRTNYKSATSHLPKVKRIIEEEERKGWIKRLPLKEAKRIYHGDLQIASLGATTKP